MINQWLLKLLALISLLEKRREFQKHRKEHYNEFSKVKLARKLIEEELKALEEDEDDDSAQSSTNKPVSHVYRKIK